uniref:Large ribosomal subunit protein bL20c n=1 Tax=Chlorokybus atmophyticus TaxID=3144 RepID=RK20_CHLAT|nr:ribosomal protein L20 [Chlorokybus atmophyticus]Q19V76.2 RecName: Full=Large ribosomal subunit protein bL20c; AltName: Full=50S ribosomal protein L20, chloroplastic [Chlorokybus atmophyticus]ABD62232.2 ribosomal protein L20 [Chlorokybus atmophyticus]WKT05664.1 ribosomal protein L20 [Chlorokybus atmophyticus]
MTRVKRGYVARKRRKRVLQLTQGFRGAHSVLFRTANQQNIKALRYASRDRARRKRDFRRLWITRINAGARKQGLSYSQLMHRFKKCGILINRKVLAQLALLDTKTFNQLVFYTDL